MSFSSNGSRDFSYKPEEGNQSADPVYRRTATHDGYYDLPGLTELLNLIISETEANIALAEGVMDKYSLVVEPESRLANAQNKEWPSDISEPKKTVPYKQYKALRKLKTRSSDYIVKQYEKYARGPSGNHNVDLIAANEIINVEAKNIKDFINNFIGDVNNTSEYRTIEILQDWAQDAIEFTRQLGSITAKGKTGQTTDPIPETELDKISRPNAIQFQTLFKTKVNAFNEEIAQVQDDLCKTLTSHSKVFYEKFLGPTLKFDLEMSRSLSELGTDRTFLGNQARNGEQSFAWQMEQVLVDALKRNEEFRAKMQGLIFTIEKRDSYNGYINQLTSSGSAVKPYFTETTLDEKEQEHFEKLEAQFSASETPLLDEEFLSDHNTLDGLDDDDAHPQYLLKAGDTITGDIAVEEGVTIDNVDLSEHNHDGTTTPKIKGEHIEGGTLGTGVIDLTQRPPAPTDLKVKHATQDVLVSGMIVWDITLEWEGDTEFSYEIQEAPYD